MRRPVVVSPEEARHLAAAAQSEEEFMAELQEVAQARGWLVYHTRDSRRSREGFPDVIALRRSAGLAFECKTVAGKARTSPQRRVAQDMWLRAFSRVLGFEGHLVTPEDWDLIHDLLA